MGVKSYMKAYHSLLTDLQTLSDAEFGIFMRGCLRYSETGEIPVFGDRLLDTLFATQKRLIDEADAEYEEICDRNRANINKRWHSDDTTVYDRIRPYTTDTKTKTKTKTTQETLSNESGKKFTPPTLAEVERYVTEAGLQMDAGAFFDHFTANGWRVSGKAPMKDWKAAVRSWARQESRFGKKAEHRPQTQYTNAELEKLEVDLGGGEFSW